VIRSILVALDASPRAQVVFRAACEIAERFDASMHLFRAIMIPPEFPASGAGGSHPDALAVALRTQAERELGSFAAGHPRASLDPPEVGVGQPWRAILDAAERLGSDLIVLGSHGCGGLDRLLGTTAGKVANHASCNVLIVHESDAPSDAAR
jgi:nucleotide-binding universal stress UspA family protein